MSSPNDSKSKKEQIKRKNKSRKYRRRNHAPLRSVLITEQKVFKHRVKFSADTGIQKVRKYDAADIEDPDGIDPIEQ